MHSTQRIMFGAAGVLGGLGVVAGAFAAHALRDRLDASELSAFETGAQYQVYHAIALLALSALPKSMWANRWLQCAGWLWLAGVVLFSGSLYGLAFTDWRWLGPVTPLGGLAFILGWVSVIGAAITSPSHDS